MPGGSRAIASARPGTTASRRHRDTNWAYETADEAQEERDRLEKEWEESLQLRTEAPARAQRSDATFARTATAFGIGAAALAFAAYRRHVRTNGHYARSLLGDGAVSSSEQVPGASL